MSALIPDLDHDTGKARQILDKLIPLMALFVVATHVCGKELFCLLEFGHLKTIGVLSLVLIGLYFLLFTYLKPKHRGITHSILLAVAYSTLVFIGFDGKLALVGFLGYLTHLITDNEIKLI